jgi:anti-sigma factor RsiW
MTRTDERMMHLDEVTLNEYLDSALAPEQRTAVESHLAQCPDCTTRLNGLRALFAELETLPEASPRRDLSPAVITVLRRRLPQSPVAAPALRAVFTAQALIALVLLGLALPTIMRATEWAVVTQLAGQAEADIAGTLTGITSELQALQISLQRFMAASLEFVRQPPLPSLPMLNVGLCLAAVSLLWLVVNGLLLLRQPSSLSRSRS